MKITEEQEKKIRNLLHTDFSSYFAKFHDDSIMECNKISDTNTGVMDQIRLDYLINFLKEL